MNEVEAVDEPHLKLVDSSYSIHVYPAADVPQNYVAFIFAKWLRSLRFGNPMFKNINSDEFYNNYHIYLEDSLRSQIPSCG